MSHISLYVSFSTFFISLAMKLVYFHLRVHLACVDLVERVDKHAIITRLLNPLVQPGHKL